MLKMRAWICLFMLCVAGYASAADVSVAEAGIREAASVQPPLFSTVMRIVLFLTALAGGGYVLVQLARKGKLSILEQWQGIAMRPQEPTQRLRIGETKFVGHKNCLVVVHYGETSMLLGVGPAGIVHLKDLPVTPKTSEPKG